MPDQDTQTDPQANLDSDQQSDNQPAPQAPTDQSELLRQMAELRAITQESVREAARSREELARERSERPSANTHQYDYGDLNQRMANGQTAEALDSLITRRQQEAMAPILQEFAASKRERNIDNLLGQVISGYSLPIGQYRDAIRTAIVQRASANPTFDEVETLVDAVVGRAMRQNPQAFMSAANPTPAAASPPTNAPARSPLPPSVPTGRPAPSNRATSVLTETEKKMKKLQYPNDEITDEEYRRLLADPASEFSFDITAPRKVSA